MSTLSQVGNTPIPVAISIPTNADNGGLGSTILDLLKIAGYAGPEPIAVIIDPKQPASATDRAAFLMASPRIGITNVLAITDFTTHGKYVPAGGNDVYIASDKAHLMSVRSADGVAVPALVLVLV